jgi:hypothetical protein
MSRAVGRTHSAGVRAGVVVGLVAVVLVAPSSASATCVVQPFDEVVRNSDAVLVATVADARPVGPHRTGVIVRLDVEQVLKGSEADGDRVAVSSCGPMIVGSAARSWAKHIVGQRNLFLLSGRGRTLSAYSEITSPQGMSLDQRIARAGRVLGIPGNAVKSSGGRGTSLWAWLVAAFACVLAAIGLAVFVRHSRR